MLDNASQDGSVEAARRHPVTTEVIALPERRGKAANDSRAAAARARAASACCSTRTPSSSRARRRPARRAGPRRAGRRGRRDARAPGRRAAAVGVALPLRRHRAADRAVAAQALRRAEQGRRRAARSTGCSRRRCSCAARRPRRSATSTRQFFVYSDEVDFCRRLAGRRLAHALRPGARAVHHEQLSTGSVPTPADRRVLPQPRPLHAQAPLGGSRPRCALPHRLDATRCGRSARSSSRPRPEALPQARHRDALPRRGEGLPRAPRSSTGGWASGVASTRLSRRAGGAQLARAEEARRARARAGSRPARAPG